MAKIPYPIAKARKEALEADTQAAGAILANGFPKGPMGLTPDNVKASPEWQEASRAYATAFQQLRDFNEWFLKEYAKEEKADREARRKARQKP
jgi:hypothetical protein